MPHTKEEMAWVAGFVVGYAKMNLWRIGKRRT